VKLTTVIYISSAEVKNVWCHTSTSPVCLNGLRADSFTATVGSLPYSQEPTLGSHIIDQFSPIHAILTPSLGTILILSSQTLRWWSCPLSFSCQKLVSVFHLCVLHAGPIQMLLFIEICCDSTNSKTYYSVIFFHPQIACFLVSDIFLSTQFSNTGSLFYYFLEVTDRVSHPVSSCANRQALYHTAAGMSVEM